MKNSIIILILVLLITSCTKREVIFDQEVTDNLELSLLLNLNGKDCLFDASTSTFKYTLSESNLDNFSPLVLFQEHSEVIFNGKQLINNQVNSFGQLTLNIPYSIDINVLGKTNSFQIIFTKIPLVQIITFDEIENEPKSLSRIIINHPNVSTPSQSFFAGIEVRGKSSSWMKKKSYGFKPLASLNMENQTSMSFFNMSVNNKWSLDGMYIEQSKVRNKTSFEIWNSLGNSSIKSQYVELFLNNASLGLYRFSENYTEELLKLSSHSSLYVGNDNTNITKFNEFPEKQPKSRIWMDWEQEYPNPKDEIYWDDFYNFTKLVAEGDNNTFSNQIESHIDIDNLIDYYLFMSLCNGYDNVGKNWFFLKQNSNSKFKILVWDLDATWGRSHSSDIQGFNLQISNNLFSRLIELNPNNFKHKLKSRWLSLRANQFSEVNLISIFDNNFKQILSYNIMNYENSIWDTYVDIEQEQIYINSWIANRLSFLDNYFNQL